MYATQATLGGALDVAEGVTASLGGFYTHREDLVVEQMATAIGDLPYRSGGTGTSNGFEALIRAHRGKLFAWVASSGSSAFDTPSA